MDVEVDTRIAELNDKFRKTSTGFMFTRGVSQLAQADEIVDLVRRFNNFNESNDPYGEHDFGKISLDGKDIFWKIDYYDQQLKYGKDPLDPTCNRVLTVLLSSEY